ncbi:MAG TPA: tRNA epoxyqueuosine(34) reductase QueG [Candidatus Binatia bacterium]|nr:tRNA epoxyqueuosine(34) reductase QueG [Candidatus Binatia bacterium]
MTEPLVNALKSRSLSLGFSTLGVVPARAGRRLEAYLDWLESNYHGQMGYMARPDRVARRRDPEVILPGAQSIICVALNYRTMELPPDVAHDPSRGRISNYAWGVDYHDAMTPRLEALAAWLQERAGGDLNQRVYVDTGAILERDHAESAGLGFTGKNTMLIGPRRGSYFFLGEILTTLWLPADEPRSMPTCGSCRRCLNACPTAAFPRPYVLDARRCISYLTIELKGWIPRDLRPSMGNWIYGCDICQDVCPFNRFAPQSGEFTLRPPDLDQAAPPLLTLLTLDDEGFTRRFAHSPIKRIKRARLLRNTCVAAGNWGSPQAVPVLANLLGDKEPLVRGHAAWALGEIGGTTARDALQNALLVEHHQEVRQELTMALGQM